MKTIETFRGAYGFLSNFHPVEVTLDGTVYRNVEAAYMAAKTHNSDERRALQEAETGKAAKRLGKRVTVRPDWSDDMRVETMARLLVEKFRLPELRGRLLSTGDSLLVERNRWSDFFWGRCGSRGGNRLGRLLEGVRHLYVVVEDCKRPGDVYTAIKPQPQPLPTGAEVAGVDSKPRVPSETP